MLTTPTRMSAASTTREVTKPIAAVRLTRLVTGYSTTAVATPEAAVRNSSTEPHCTAALLPGLLMYPVGSAMTSANSFSCGIEAANVTR